MRITESEYAENRRAHTWLTYIDVKNIIKFIAGMALLVMLRYGLME
jgi:hypothetical protein